MYMFSGEMAAKFRSKILHNSGAFRFALREDSEEKFFCLPLPLGDATLLYETTASQHNNSVVLDPSASLFGVMKNGVLYVDIDKNDALPDGTGRLSDAAEEMKTQCKSYIDRYYKALKPARKIPANWIEYVERDARIIAFGLENAYRLRAFEVDLNTCDLISWLMGKFDLEQFASEYCDAHKEEWAKRKRYEQAVYTKASDPNLVRPWEQRLIKALQSLKGDCATVEFTKSGKTASTKMVLGMVMHSILGNAYFNAACFASYEHEEQLLNDLGLEPNFNDPHLSHVDISRVIYRNKTIYKKESIEK